MLFDICPIAATVTSDFALELWDKKTDSDNENFCHKKSNIKNNTFLTY